LELRGKWNGRLARQKDINIKQTSKDVTDRNIMHPRLYGVRDCRNTEDIRLCYALDGILTVWMPVV
jgi:hypothetical protein